MVQLNEIMFLCSIVIKTKKYTQ